jgi:hypothetical protein
VRYLVSITPDPAVIDQVDQSGGVMPLLTRLKETFKPEAFYLEERARAEQTAELAKANVRYQRSDVGRHERTVAVALVPGDQRGHKSTAIDLALGEA